MKIYENIIIGNFLFALGYSISSKNGDKPFVGNINLVQQTPADHLLGDLMANLNNHVYLIEFKEASNKSNKELRKYQRLKAILDDPAFANYLSISKKIHWYIETSVSRHDFNNQTLISRIAPYIELAENSSKELKAFERLIEKIANDVVSPSDPANIEATEGYLNLVRKTLGGTGAFGSGGLLLSVNARGEINYIVMEDLMDLRMTYGQWHDSLEKSWEMKKQHQLELDKELERTHKRKLDGPSFGY